MNFNKCEPMQVVLAKDAQKYYNKVDTNTRKKLDKCMNKISLGDGTPLLEINRHRDMDNLYRLKIEHYGIIFRKANGYATILVIDTKSNIRHRKTGCM